MDGREPPEIIAEVPRPDTAGRRILWGALLAGTGLSLAASAAVAFRTLTLGSADGGWVYGYGPLLSPAVFGVACGAAAAALVLLRLTVRQRLAAGWLLAIWIGAAFGLHAAIRTLAPDPLERLFRSDAANSFYSVSLRHAPLEMLGRFNRIRHDAPPHARSNMPGKVLLLHALGTLSTRADVLPWLVVLVSSLGAIPAFLFARALFDDVRSGLFGAVLYLFVPAKLFFFPLMNTVTPAIVLACAWVLVWWLKTGSPVRAAVLGASLYAMVLFEPLPLVIGLLFLGLCVRAWARGVVSGERVILGCALGALTFIAMSEAVRVATGFDLVRAFRQIGDHAVEFNREAGRPYAVWMRANLGEFAFGTGLAQVALFAGTMVVTLGGGGRWRDRVLAAPATVCLSLAAVLAAVDAIGINRGEVLRLWIFLACFFQIPAAWACARLGGVAPIALVVGTSILQACLGTAMVRFVVP